ncbi:hypothetical protein, partial [Tropicimonas sp. IMCC6043]|uniref:hypothetical protein n=1 Tax=Tropicimonas sp. IMCC6043 TaxID=2510645 RepID=UPI001A91F87E
PTDAPNSLSATACPCPQIYPEPITLANHQSVTNNRLSSAGEGVFTFADRGPQPLSSMKHELFSTFSTTD